MVHVNLSHEGAASRHSCSLALMLLLRLCGCGGGCCCGCCCGCVCPPSLAFSFACLSYDDKPFADLVGMFARLRLCCRYCSRARVDGQRRAGLRCGHFHRLLNALLQLQKQSKCLPRNTRPRKALYAALQQALCRGGPVGIPTAVAIHTCTCSSIVGRDP